MVSTSANSYCSGLGPADSLVTVSNIAYNVDIHTYQELFCYSYIIIHTRSFDLVISSFVAKFRNTKNTVMILILKQINKLIGLKPVF